MCAKTSPTSAAPAPHPSLETGVPELVVNAPLLFVGEDLVGLVDRLELCLGGGIARVAIRMMLQGLPLVGLAHFLRAGGSLDPEYFVIIPLFRHGAEPRRAAR